MQTEPTTKETVKEVLDKAKAVTDDILAGDHNAGIVIVINKTDIMDVSRMPARELVAVLENYIKEIKKLTEI